MVSHETVLSPVKSARKRRKHLHEYGREKFQKAQRIVKTQSLYCLSTLHLATTLRRIHKKKKKKWYR